MRRLQKYLALAPAGRAMVLRSLLVLPLVSVLLRTHGMARTQARLDRMGYGAKRDPGAMTPREIARLVDAAASFLRASCLSRSLLLCQFLRQRGIPAELRLGVSKLADGKLSAHAWVELDGLPINDVADVCARYAALPSFQKELRIAQS